MIRIPFKAGASMLTLLLALAACDSLDEPVGLEYDSTLAALVGPDILGDLDTDLVVAGAKLAVGGVGLKDVLSGQINVDVPAGATIHSVHLYWGARWDFPPNQPLDMIEVTVGASTMDVEGQYIGTEVIDPGNDSHSWRADLLAEGFSFSAGATNTVDLVIQDDGVDGAGIDGASVVITYDDGTAGSVELRDGNDFAYEPRGLQTNEQTFDFAPSSSDRTAKLLLVVGDVEGARPSQVVITSGGSGDQTLDNAFGDYAGNCGRDGAQWDTCVIDVAVPAGSTQLSAQLLSWDDPTDVLPASLYWVVGALELVDPPPPPLCVGLTPGYWRNWDNHYTQDQFEGLLAWVNANDYYDSGSLTVSELTGILSYGGNDAVQRLRKFYYANLLTLALTDAPGLPNPDGAGLGPDCAHPDFDASLGEALAEAEGILDGTLNYNRGKINGVKDMLDKFANLDD